MLHNRGLAVGGDAVRGQVVVLVPVGVGFVCDKCKVVVCVGERGACQGWQRAAAAGQVGEGVDRPRVQVQRAFIQGGLTGTLPAACRCRAGRLPRHQMQQQHGAAVATSRVRAASTRAARSGRRFSVSQLRWRAVAQRTAAAATTTARVRQWLMLLQAAPISAAADGSCGERVMSCPSQQACCVAAAGAARGQQRMLCGVWLQMPRLGCSLGADAWGCVRW